MAIEVEGPDGAIIEFPDGTTPDVMKGAMAKRYASLSPPDTGPGRFAAPQMKGMELPKVAPAAPKLLEEGMFISAWENPDGSRSLGAGSMTKPIVEGIKNALPAAARYKSFDPESTDEVIKSVVPPASVMGPGSVGGLGWAGRPMAAKPPPAMSPDGKPVHRVPREELKAAGKAAYDRADESGVIFTPEGLSRVAKNVTDDFAAFGYDKDIHTNIAPALKRILTAAEQGNVTVKGMDILRQVAKAAGESIKPSEGALSGKMIDHIDDLIMNPRAGDVLVGDTGKAAAALKEARTLWSRMRKTELIDRATGHAELRAASTGSGGNEHNAIRQNLRALLTNEKHARSFSAEEKKAIEAVVRGSAPLNTLRLFGKLSPEGNGLMMMMSGGPAAFGALTANPLLAVPAVVGYASKRLADRGMHKAVDRLTAMTSSGQPAKVAVNWGDMVTKYQTGSASEPALRLAAMALARQIASGTGEDEKAVADALMESVGDA